MAEFNLPQRVLHGFAVCLAVLILLLICSGGLVTSHEAGMTVPDWPNSFGYNMFLFPISRWIGGVFFEHTHRLIASGVGMLTIVLSVAAWVIERRRWVKWLTVVAVGAVVVQGVLGGLRVTEHNALLGLFHGCLAQSYFCLVSVIALVTSSAWERLGANVGRASRPSAFASSSDGRDARPTLLAKRLFYWALVVTAMIFVQLVLGASMRHSHAGLSIHDFPTVYGQWWPAVDSNALNAINAARESQKEPDTTLGLIWLQYVHRLWAVAIVCGLAITARRILRSESAVPLLRILAALWIGIVLAQFCLGIWTVWSNKAADVATAHVALGATTLMIGVLISTILGRLTSMTVPSGVLTGAGDRVPAASV
jgi:heme a synthase